MDEIEAKVARMTREEQEDRLIALNVKLKILQPQLLNGDEPETSNAVDMLERRYLMKALGLK
jgi:hypothetical protein